MPAKGAGAVALRFAGIRLTADHGGVQRDSNLRQATPQVPVGTGTRGEEDSEEK
jgi:hypothetical protein